LIRTRDQNVPENICKATSAGYTHARRKDFFQGGPTVDFSRRNQKSFFPGGVKALKFYFFSGNFWKLRKQPLFAKSATGKCQISNAKGKRPSLVAPRRS